ncbi:hypothetical protein [uncultured Bacteroides sp.]|uniref:hypothetical protein n=1 Tax=uncultured Bacteroides sp. TaxID=162156 RepID=UPI00261B1CCF|nr:hypothetical protein [uncultured Bacteroides sp.]
MRKVVIIFMALVGCLVYPIVIKAQEIKDAFVLVDVSGSMRYAQINQEAKQIISCMLQGNLSLSNYQGWSRVTGIGLDSNCPLISGNAPSLVSAGGKVCIMPFGNMERVEDYKFVDMSNFNSSFNSLFPMSFKDRFTYITLAKAYAVNVASHNGISGMIYMIIYSDGAQECMNGDIGYPSPYRQIVDYFGTCKDSFCQKKGILRKSVGNKDFDIEIWTMGPIPISTVTEVKQTSEKKNIEISNQPKGKSTKAPVEINVKEPITLKWRNADGKVNVNVQRKAGNKYTNILAKDKANYYTLEKKANSASITFYEAEDYRIIVADGHSRDERYFKAIVPIGSAIFPFIIVVLLVIGGVCLWRLLAPNKSISNDNQNHGRKVSDENSDNGW